MSGVSIEAWVELWIQSHAFVQGAPVRLSWPDGRPTLCQPKILVDVFALIGDEVRKELMEAQAKNARN